MILPRPVALCQSPRELCACLVWELYCCCIYHIPVSGDTPCCIVQLQSYGRCVCKPSKAAVSSCGSLQLSVQCSMSTCFVQIKLGQATTPYMQLVKSSQLCTRCHSERGRVVAYACSTAYFADRLLNGAYELKLLASVLHHMCVFAYT